MKNIKSKLYVLAAFFVIASCSKEEKIRVEDSNSNSTNQQFLSLSQKRYDEIKEIVNNEFSNPTKKLNTQIGNVNEAINWDNEIKALKTNKSQNVVPQNMNEEITLKYRSIVASVPELKGFKSILSIFVDGLQIKDKGELKAFASRYEEFIIYFEEFNTIMLSVPKYKAAILSPNGIIKLEDKIIQYNSENTKVIKNGDINLINDLVKTNKSTDNIEVISNVTNNGLGKTRLSSTSAVRYHPDLVYYAIGLVKFVDHEIGPGSNNKYIVGCEAATFFNGAPTIVIDFGLATYNRLAPYPYSPPALGYVSYSGLVWAATDFIFADPILFLPTNPFSTIASWNVKYLNGFVFTGSW